MKKIPNILISILLYQALFFGFLQSCSSIYQCEPEKACKKGGSQNFWLPQPIGNSGTRDILIMQELNFKKLTDLPKTFVNIFGATVNYSRNFGQSRGKYGLGALPFWSGTNTMTIGDNSGKYDLDAYQFGLGEIIKPGEITLNPIVMQIGTTFLNYAIQNKEAAGVYLKAQLNYGCIYIDPNSSEIPAILDPVNYNAPADLNLQTSLYPDPPEARYKTLTEALHAGYSYQFPLYRYGKLQRCRAKDMNLADATLVIGYNFVVTPHSHFGVGGKILYPLGSLYEAEYMLQPILGNAGHSGLGIDVSGHYSMFFNTIKSQSLHLWLQAQIQHLFPGRKPTFRSFDLAANGPGSKYLLLQHYTYNVNYVPNNPENESLVTLSALSAAINYTTVPVLSSFPMEGNCTVMATYQFGNIDLGIAAEVWGRSRETLKIDLCQAFEYAKEPGYDYNLNNYAVMGRQIPAFDNTTQYTYNWCEPLARINESLPALGNSAIQNPYPERIKDGTLPVNRIPQDYNVALDINGARLARIINGKVTGTVGVTFINTSYTPRFAIFGTVELNPKKNYVNNFWSLGMIFGMQY